MSYRVHQYRKSPEQRFIESILKALWWLVSLPFRLIFGRKFPKKSIQQAESLDQNHLVSKWKEIEELISLGRPSNYAKAVLEADKLLDHLLKSHRTPGLTMGDRLKASHKRFSKSGYDAAWKAHKVRNELVHNSKYEITDFIAKETITNFKKAIDELR